MESKRVGDQTVHIYQSVIDTVRNWCGDSRAVPWPPQSALMAGLGGSWQAAGRPGRVDEAHGGVGCGDWTRADEVGPTGARPVGAGQAGGTDAAAWGRGLMPRRAALWVQCAPAAVPWGV